MCYREAFVSCMAVVIRPVVRRCSFDKWYYSASGREWNGEWQGSDNVHPLLALSRALTHTGLAVGVSDVRA